MSEDHSVCFILIVHGEGCIIYALVTSTSVSVKQDVLGKLSLAEIKLSQLSQQQGMLTAQHHLELEKVRSS